MECKFKADLPYPDFQSGKNINDIKLLMPVYSGRDGETTAIMSYIYYSYVTKQQYPELSYCLEKIAITEMHHHELLGTAIVILGGTPYIGGNYSYWQGSYVNYTKDITSMLRGAILGEKQAIMDYRNVYVKTSTQAVKELVERIIADEEVHIETLTELLKIYSSVGAG